MNKNNILLLILIFTGHTLLAQSQTGIIKGRIVSFSREPLANVSITLQNTHLGSTTDKNGYFIITNIPAGTYAVVASSIGYTAIKKNIVVAAAKISALDLQLSENKQELQDVVVLAKQGGYKQNNTSLATRADIPLIEVPQSAQTITQQVIQDRQSFTLNEISKVLTGVKANNEMGAFSLRGFTGYYPFDGSFITFNGIRGNLYLWSQAPLLYNVERVEVLRGPASVMFSESIPGGSINFVTKKPQAEKRFEFSAAYGGWNFARFSADATGAISKNKKLLYRIIAGYDRGNSFRDQQKKENVLVAPSLTYQFDNTASINLEINYAYAKAVHQYDRGAFVKTNTDGSYDFNFYPKELTIQSPTDFGKTKNSSATLTFSKQFNKKLSVNLTQRYIRNKFNFADHVVRGQIRNDSVSRSYEIWDYDQFSFQTTGYANYKFTTGRVGHSLLAGIDYNNYGWYKNDYRSSVSNRISIFKPDYTNDIPAPDPSSDYYDDNKQTIQLVGAYLQDMLSLGKFRLLLSLRHDDYKLVQTPLSDKDDLQGDKSEASAWVPRAGLVYLAAPNISFYSSYNKSFTPQLSNSAGSGGPFPPKTAEQFEVGYKGDFFNNQLSTAIAFYNINYRNILVAAPTDANPNLQTVAKGTRSQGIEITLQGNIKNLSIIGGYAYNEHLLTADNSLGKKGYRFINAPRNIGNIWVTYNVARKTLKGLALSIGGRYMSNQVGNLATQNYLIPQSTVLDAAAHYAIKRFTFQFNLYNFTNQRYFNGGLSRIPYASLGDPINFRFGINYLIK